MLTTNYIPIHVEKTIQLKTKYEPLSKECVNRLSATYMEYNRVDLYFHVDIHN